MIDAIARRYSPATLVLLLIGVSLLDTLLTVVCWEFGLSEGSPFYLLASYDIILLGIFKLIATSIVVYLLWVKRGGQTAVLGMKLRTQQVSALCLVTMSLVCLINVVALVSGVIE